MPARRSLALLAFVLTALPASAVDLLDRAQVAQRRPDGVMVASLTPLASLPLMQVYVSGGGGGGGTGNLVMGTSTDDCGTAGGVFFDLSGKVQCDADIKFVTDTLTITKVAAPTSVTVGTTTTAGTATAVHSATMSGGATTSNFVNVTGTMPNAAASWMSGVNFQLTTTAGAAGGDANVAGLRVSLLAGKTSNQGAFAGLFESTIAAGGTDTGASTYTTGSENNGAMLSAAVTAGPATNYGHVSYGGNSVISVGALDIGYSGSTSTIGTWGAAITNAGTRNFSGLFTQSTGGTAIVNSALPTGSAALAASNMATTDDIIRLYDNTSLVHSVQDGGNPTWSVGGRTHTPVAGVPAFYTAEAYSGRFDTNSTTGYSLLLVGNGSTSVIGQGGSAVTENTSFRNAAVWWTAGTYPIVLSTNSGDVRDYIEDAAKTLTETTNTTFVRIGVASGSSASGVVFYSVNADDGTDFQNRGGSVSFSVVNKAGTESCALGVPADAVAESAGASTLTVAFAADTATPTNGCDLQANATSSLTQTTLAIRYRVVLNPVASTATVTPQ